eukprot:3111232-Amphidinium_carterae.5
MGIRLELLRGLAAIEMCVESTTALARRSWPGMEAVATGEGSRESDEGRGGHQMAGVQDRGDRDHPV